MNTRIYQVDAFTDKPFAGNPAAVCVLEREMDDSWMLYIAQEMNLSETAFLNKVDDGYSLRWFTPVREVSLSGHATLASAHILWQTGILAEDERAVFHTQSGKLSARKLPDGIEMEFPKIKLKPTRVPQGLLQALNVSPRYIGTAGKKYVIQVESEEVVRNFIPDNSALRKLRLRGVALTARATAPEYDFVSRYFAPSVGIDEDPVTGSNHCFLGPFWAKKFGRNELKAYQASPRGGFINVRVYDDHVFLSGQAVTIFAGELKV